ncbi:MAG: mannose-1-phosphate guanyltransferase, partial [Deltaproteobacteria bacterium]|nr:mannose-1-phosphate guanyltransferase [Deltaproteobacteria bacterium]
TVDLGTAGSVAGAMRPQKGVKATNWGSTLVISADVLTDIDLTAAMAFHKKRRSMATLILTRVENPLAYGIVITDKNGKIVRFLEKPSWGEVFSDTVNTGIYILEKKALDLVPEGVEFDFSKDLFPMLLKNKMPLYGYIADGYWKDVGSLSEYRQANMDILNQRVHVNISGEHIIDDSTIEGSNIDDDSGVWMGEGSQVDFTAKLTGTVIVGNNCRIEPGAVIANCVLSDGTVVKEGAELRDSVLWEGVSVGARARLQENIVGNNTTIGADAYLGEGVVVSDYCKIGIGSTVKANVKVWPHKEVEEGATLASSLIWGQKWARSIFSTYGVTGLANIELSPEFAAKLGAAYGASLDKGSIVSTSRDPHKTSRMINRAIMTGILSTGVNVHDYGVTPMPVVRYLARGGNDYGGVHTRRSPFDAQLLDLKFFDKTGLDLHPGAEKSVERLFFREDFRRVPMEDTGEMVFPIHGIETYRNAFLSAIDVEAIKGADFKVVIDYSYGSSSRILPPILGKLNCEVIALNANLDGTKTTKTAEDFAHGLDQLSTIVRSLKADIGFMLDSGGEKVFIVDDTGEIIDGETALSLITLLVLKSAKRAGLRGGSVAVPVTASRGVEEMAKTYGFKAVRTKTTAHGLMEAATAKDVFFVAEETGGFIFPNFQPVFDGMFVVAKVLEMVAGEGVRLHKLIREIPPSVMLRELAPCSWESKGMIMRRLAEDSSGKPTILIDGIRISYGHDWIIAYPSQTNSYFHLVAEAATEEKGRELITEYSEKIKLWQGEGAKTNKNLNA